MLGALAIALLSAAAPLFARASETLFHLPPCALCLWQRWPYWAGAALAALALAAGRPWRGRLLAAAGAAAAVSALIAAFHLGVEFGWWPSPLPGCAAPAVNPALSLEEMMAQMRPTPTKPCDEPAFLIPGLPLSMAGMNLIYGGALAALALRLSRKEFR